MKNAHMKKAVSLLLVVVMLLGMLGVTAAAAENQSELTVTGGEAILKPGDELTATMTLPASTIEVCNYELTISFNTEVLEATNVQFSGTSTAVVSNASEGNKNGFICACDAWADEKMIGVMTLTVTFKVRDDAVSGSYDKLIWINEDKTLWGDPEGVESTPAYGNKSYGSTVNGKAVTVIPEGAPFTKVYTDVEGIVAITKLDGKENYDGTSSYDGGETDRWHMVVPENATKLYLVYPLSDVKYLSDTEPPMVCGYQKYYYVDSDTVEKGLFDTSDLEIDGDNITIAINIADFAGEKSIQSWTGEEIKYTRAFTLRNNSEKATGHITLAYKDGYSVDLTEDAQIAADEQVQLTLNVSDTYNAFYYELSYDAAALEFVSASAGTAKAADGKLTIAGYGEDRTAPLTLTFKGLAVGVSSVTLTKANIDEKSNADAQDAPAATIGKSTANITVGSYQVTLPEEFIGESVAYPGQDYTFEAKDKNYDYSVKAMVGTNSVDVTENNGVFTIPAASINGNIAITSTKTGKIVSVTVDGGGKDGVTAEAQGRYMEDYTFSVADDEYNYTITVKINGVDYPIAPNADGLTYTIPGKDMIPDTVRITAERELKPASQTTVQFTGTGAADVVGGTTQTGEAEKDFTFTISSISMVALPATFVTQSGETVTEGILDGNVQVTEIPAKSDVSASDFTNFGADIPHYTVYMNQLANVEMQETTPEGYTEGGVFTIDEDWGACVDPFGGHMSYGMTEYLVGKDADGKYTILAAFDFKAASEMPASDAVYTVTLDGETLTPGADGSYTVPAAKMVAGETVTVNVEKTEPICTVEVSEYLKLDGKSIWLVTATPKAALAEGKTLAYDGSAMFTSSEYGGYAYLVISADTMDDVKTAAQAAIAEIEATSEAVSYNFDVNGTKVVDVNDAQLVYNMYNASYDSFEKVSMLKFLEADVNGDKTVTTLDTAAIIDHILG